MRRSKINEGTAKSAHTHTEVGEGTQGKELRDAVLIQKHRWRYDRKGQPPKISLGDIVGRVISRHKV